jgi:chemotaxis protein CheD
VPILTVGIADCQVSKDPESVLVTHALGSCIAVAVYDPVTHVGGLLHFMLPDSAIDPKKAQQKPYMFADIGIPTLFHAAYAIGAEKRRLIVRVIGGAQVYDSQGVFNIGKRNYLACRKILWANGLLIHAEEVGGSASRTMRLDLSSGELWWHGPAEQEQQLAPSKGDKLCHSGF